MIERHVRTNGRPVYGRAMPLKRPARRGSRRPKLSPLQGRVVVMILLVLVVGWGIGRMSTIDKVEVAAPSRAGEIQSAALKLTDSNWKWGNQLTFDAESFTSRLKEEDPALKDVSVKRKGLNTLVVTATLKQPSLGWNTGNQTYVLDRDGTIIGTVTGSPAFPVIVDGSNVPVQTGQRVVSANFVQFVQQVVPALAATGITVTRFDIKDTTLDLSAQTNKGYKLLFDTSRGAEEEVADLRAVQRLLASQKKVPAEYIDLRIAGKAYYK